MSIDERSDRDGPVLAALVDLIKKHDHATPEMVAQVVPSYLGADEIRAALESLANAGYIEGMTRDGDGRIRFVGSVTRRGLEEVARQSVADPGVNQTVARLDGATAAATADHFKRWRRWRPLAFWVAGIFAAAIVNWLTGWGEKLFEWIF